MPACDITRTSKKKNCPPIRCDVCDVDLPNQDQQDTHFGGRKHLKKVAAQTSATSTEGKAQCVICETTFPNELQEKQHYESKKHLKKASSVKVAVTGAAVNEIMPCDSCNVDFPNEGREQHFNGENHLKKSRQVEETNEGQDTQSQKTQIV